MMSGTQDLLTHQQVTEELVQVWAVSWFRITNIYTVKISDYSS